MAKKVNATAKENNVKENVAMENVENTVNAPVEETATATVETPVNAENVKENVAMENTATVETVETVETPAPVETVEETRQKLLYALEINNAKIQAINAIDEQGNKINPTNWAKDETSKGNETLGMFVRAMLNDVKQEKATLKAQLKATYFDVSPYVLEMLNYDDNNIKVLARQAMDKMTNVIIINTAILAQNKDIINTLYILGVEEIGVNAENLGFAMVSFTACGYQFDYINPQPVNVEERTEKGLETIPAYSYFSFKRVEKQ